MIVLRLARVYWELPLPDPRVCAGEVLRYAMQERIRPSLSHDEVSSHSPGFHEDRERGDVSRRRLEIHEPSGLR
jgi:hypothetical protein